MLGKGKSLQILQFYQFGDELQLHFNILSENEMYFFSSSNTKVVEWYYIISIVLECYMLKYPPSQLKYKIPNSYLM